MGRSSINYIEKNGLNQRNNITNPVIYGRFPKYVNKKSPVDKINKFLVFVLLGLVCLSVISYYFVSDGEKNMNKIGRDIVALSNENIELQNKLDKLHSFNKIDAIMQGKTTLDTAKRVIEIPFVNLGFIPKIQSQPVNYHWSIGY